MWPLVPYRAEEVTALTIREGDGPGGKFAKGSGEFDHLIAHALVLIRVTGHVEDHQFKLVVQPPRFWRIPYLPVLVGTLHDSRVHVTARPQIYELRAFLPLWCALVLFWVVRAWFALGFPAVYHLVGWGAFCERDGSRHGRIEGSVGWGRRLTKR